MKPGGRTLLFGAALAAFGAWLAYDAAISGSLWRYRLAGYLAGALLCVPLLSRLLLGGTRASRLWRRVAFAAVPLLGCLLLGELAMRAFGPPREPPTRLLVDERLGHVVAPGTAGTDDRGWRNPEALARADVLFVGDSQTYGFGVDVDETFCALCADPERTCYQMSNGSYGPVQYVELVRRGLELRPRAVVVTIYLGNDLIDAWDYAGLVGAEPLRSDDVAYVVRDNPEFHGEHSPNLTMAIVDAVLAGSALLDRAATVVKSRLRGGAFDQVAGSVPFEHETLATVLQPDYRHPVVDRAQPKVRDGIDVTRRCVAAIAALCEQQGARLVVAVLPTKERVYADFAELPACAELADDERRAHDLLFGAGLPDGAVLVDLSAPLLDAMGRGDMPWFSSADGHLAAGGHRAVARALRERLGW